MNLASSRRRFLQLACAGAVIGLAGCSQSANPPAQGETDRSTDTVDVTETATDSATPITPTSEPGDGTPPESVELGPLVVGLDEPLDVAFVPDADYQYVVERNGRILAHDDGLRDSPALDIRDSVETGSEKGLLGIELHPEFASNRRLFVRYSAASRSGTPSNYSHTFVLAEFRTNDAGTRVDPDSERTILEIPQPQSNHNAGDIAFGPDGYLYVPVGDGGSGADQGRGHVGDWWDGVDGGNGQDVTENLLGSILRLDVDAADDDRAYAIPEDNPLVGRDGLNEQYAWGFRNPWRMSFDGEDLFVGDVGQGDYEEVNLVEKGGNYGWNVWEGAHCFRSSGCPTETPDDVRGGEPLVDPIIEYPHSDAPVSGISVIGGEVYRGSALAGADGVYVFGDYLVKGRLFAATERENGQWEATTVELAGGGGRLRQLRSFGRDADGELYAVGTGEDGGGVYRIAPAE